MIDTTYKSKVGYKPPVELEYHEGTPEIKSVWDNMRDAEGRILDQVEEHIVAQCSVAVGVKIDREELIKALRYDRGQYDKGYQDGIRDSAGELQYFKNRVCELCGITHADSGDPNNCELAGHGVWIVRYTTPSSNYKSCTCGICGHERIFRPDEVPKFCEECGSKMAPVIVERKDEKV